jgi:hypothetical protein
MGTSALPERRVKLAVIQSKLNQNDANAFFEREVLDAQLVLIPLLRSLDPMVQPL